MWVGDRNGGVRGDRLFGTSGDGNQEAVGIEAGAGRNRLDRYSSRGGGRFGIIVNSRRLRGETELLP